MLTLTTLRMGLIVAAAVIGAGFLYWLADAIGDVREAQVRAKIDKAIEITNRATGEQNDADEETLALAEKLRLAAVATAMKLPRKSQCELTADEATALGRIQ